MLDRIAQLLHDSGPHPLWQGLVIILGTFVLEDAATILTAMQVRSGGLAGSVALTALYLGIGLGDLGLYGLGMLAARFPLLQRWASDAAAAGAPGRNWFQRHVFRVVFVSRFVPGARLPAYTACGFFRAGIMRFAAAAIGAILIWTTLLFALSLRVGGWLMTYLGAWRWAGMVGFAVLILGATRFVAHLNRKRV